MTENPRPGGLAEVNSNIKSGRVHDPSQSVLATASQLHQIGQFLVGQSVEVWRLLVRDDHQVAAVIWIGVEHRETGPVTGDDVVGQVIIRLGHPGKKRLLRSIRFRR